LGIGGWQKTQLRKSTSGLRRVRTLPFVPSLRLLVAAALIACIAADTAAGKVLKHASLLLASGCVGTLVQLWWLTTNVACQFSGGHWPCFVTGLGFMAWGQQTLGILGTGIIAAA
jgi:hypothetical protein